MAILILDKKYISQNSIGKLISEGLPVISDDIDDYPDGIIIPVDKPYRWTSADVIRKVKFNACRHFHKKNLKVGHAGTLDPLATGVLLVCIGKATRQAEELQKHEKEYVAGISFGATTPSYDLEKEIDRFYPTDNVSMESLRALLPDFLGWQEQIAPLFSAKSVDGVRAYELARKEWRRMRNPGHKQDAGNVNESSCFRTGENGQEDMKTGFDHSAVELLNRQKINISELEILRFCPDGIPAIYDKSVGHTEDDRHSSTVDLSSLVNPDGSENKKNSRIHVTDNSSLHLPHAEVRVVCSKGTYIRALARDFGEALGSGAHLDALRRTRNGGFNADDALSIDQAIMALK